jgi:hypothetical protein
MHLTGAALVGSPQAFGKAGAAGAVLRAGDFSVTVPEQWKATAVIEKVPMKPLYTEAEWKGHQEDPQPERQRREEADITMARLIYKPSYDNRPEHWALRFPAAAPEGIPADLEDAGNDPTAPQILIHRASEWPAAHTDGKHPDPKTKSSPKELRERMDAVLKKDDWHLSPAFMDASLTFMCLKRPLEFDGGRGVRMLAQWTVERDLLRKGQLHYLFLGMSNDDSCQIIATFPVVLPGLPDEETKEHLGRSLQKYEDFTRDFDAYSTEATKWLGQHSNAIASRLDQLDAVMKSLVARRWT